MSGFWSKAGRLLSRRTAATLAVVALVTIAMGFGLQRLDFATGQDSYIDPASQVAKDNKDYQNLFGGENMVVLFTVPEGKTVVDLFTPANVTQLNDIEATMATSDAVSSVVSPLTLLQWTQDLITKGVASEIIARTIERDTDPTAQATRREDAMITTLRLGGAGEQSMDNPEWVKFLVFGNDGYTLDADGKVVAPPDSDLVVRKALQAFIPDARHAVLAAVLVGNAPLDQLAEGSADVQDALERPHLRQRCRDDHRHTDVPHRHQRLLAGRDDDPRRDRRARDDGDLAGCLQGALAAAAVGRHGRRDRLGIRRFRIHRHETVARHDCRPADPDRPRHRVRDPDPESHRGGTHGRALGQSLRRRHSSTWDRR